jgi:hypothetical protein
MSLLEPKLRCSANHWHLVLWPRADGDLPEFMRWLTVAHTQRWHAAHASAGTCQGAPKTGQ